MNKAEKKIKIAAMVTEMKRLDATNDKVLRDQIRVSIAEAKATW